VLHSITSGHCPIKPPWRRWTIAGPSSVRNRTAAPGKRTWGYFFIFIYRIKNSVRRRGQVLASPLKQTGCSAVCSLAKPRLSKFHPEPRRGNHAGPYRREWGLVFWSAALFLVTPCGMESSSSSGGRARRRSWGSGGDSFDIPAKGAPVERLKKWRVSSSPPHPAPSWRRSPTTIR
jgi:hypothetical protein